MIITFDQWRGDWWPTTKTGRRLGLINIDNICRMSTNIRRCYTSSPQCVPSRASWITGLYPSQLGVTRNCSMRIPERAPSIMRELQAKGWHTQIIGKTHWTEHNRKKDIREDEDLIKKIGFNHVKEIVGPRALRQVECELTDEWKKNKVYEEYVTDMNIRYGKGFNTNAWTTKPTVLPDELYPDIWIANQSVNEIKALPTNSPWCLWISFVGPHEPFDTPLKWKQSIEIDNELSSPFELDWIKDLPNQSNLKKMYSKWEGLVTKEAVKELRHDYACRLKLLDEQIGKIHKAIRERSDYANTELCLTADHGEMLGDGGMLYKSTFIESSIRVPFTYMTIKRERKDIKGPCELTKSLSIVKNNVDIHLPADKKRKSLKDNQAIVEYEDEILLIKGKLKICMSKDYEVLWCSKVREEGDAEHQVLRSKSVSIRDRLRLKKMKKIIKSEVEKRKRNEWIWQDI